ncbi:beta family protein [Marinobacter sp. Arc7-DN-1]|uniref:beta family protein n=1 Tax=Marinobacter sp. Arc7-DN-1 TaxID=2304594 RepID=UPI000E4423E5|nr:beta family protein [Marinobacter sp. Arc7-DN-1]AXS83274.1 beta family protein [Marinobacter sp. Arc7-DN-1]
MSNYKYFPIIKTRDAELRCFEHISDSNLNQMLPIYELTKSRKTTKTPDGDIHRRMSKIKDLQHGRPFILDLSTDEAYSNPQIEQLLSERGSFYEWQIFIFELYSELNIIPMIHVYEDDNGILEEVKKFVSYASSKKNLLAIRLPFDLTPNEVDFYLSPIRDNLKNNSKLIVLLDAGFIRHEADADTSKISNMFIETFQAVSKCLSNRLEDAVMLCSSFPSSPAQEGAKNASNRAEADSEGEFTIYEEIIYQEILMEGVHIKYGDYASINNEQIEIRGGTFVPRIDIALPDGKTFIYKRYRRDDGSYQRCANKMIEDERYVNNKGWADEEIALAASGKPTGISPAYWISVRMEYYINSRLKLRT